MDLAIGTIGSRIAVTSDRAGTNTRLVSAHGRPVGDWLTVPTLEAAASHKHGALAHEIGSLGGLPTGSARSCEGMVRREQQSANDSCHDEHRKCEFAHAG